MAGVIRKRKKDWQIMKSLKEEYDWNFPYHINVMKPNAESEGYLHWLVKSACAWILRDLKKNYVAEIIIMENGGRLDLFNITDRHIIEVESNLTPERKLEKRNKYENELVDATIFIDLKKVPTDRIEMFNYLKEKITDPSKTD